MWSVRWREGISGEVGGGGYHDLVLQKLYAVLLVRSQKSRHFAAYETYEGTWKHLVGLPSGVLKVVVWVSQHIEQSLNQLFIL